MRGQWVTKGPGFAVTMASAYLGWGFLKGSGLQYFGGSVASIPFLLYGNVLLHLINVTVEESGQRERETRLEGNTLKSGRPE